MTSWGFADDSGTAVNVSKCVQENGDKAYFHLDGLFLASAGSCADMVAFVCGSTVGLILVNWFMSYHVQQCFRLLPYGICVTGTKRSVTWMAIFAILSMLGQTVSPVIGLSIAINSVVSKLRWDCSTLYVLEYCYFPVIQNSGFIMWVKQFFTLAMQFSGLFMSLARRWISLYSDFPFDKTFANRVNTLTLTHSVDKVALTDAVADFYDMSSWPFGTKCGMNMGNTKNSLRRLMLDPSLVPQQDLEDILSTLLSRGQLVPIPTKHLSTETPEKIMEQSLMNFASPRSSSGSIVSSFPSSSSSASSSSSSSSDSSSAAFTPLTVGESLARYQLTTLEAHLSTMDSTSSAPDDASIDVNITSSTADANHKT
eukprot:TRINITY_DN1754_c0_g1_i2.p1 TRINITY_DN1754_c0_g1~~TRINITY_DN1754_c0_g1_i2.p1  ORF type:complete len:369 (-),score=81.30 TRINITY_DN1754_c0_g1_i2:202-1308(-)